MKGLRTLPYNCRLRELKLFPLEYGQVRGDLIQAYRILRNRECALNPDDFFTLATTTNLRGNSLKLRGSRCRLDVRKYCFSQRVVGAWNGLPEDVIMADTTETFKQRLDAYLLGHYRLPE